MDTYEPAVALVKAEPKIPEEVRPQLIKKLIVEVNITIDSTGKVVRAEPIPQKGLSQLLLNSVVKASLSCKFKPALHNQRPVTSESILKFVFHP
jgi:hypothetical protein